MLTTLGQGPMTPSELAARLQVKRTTASNALRELHRDGLLRRKKVPGRTKPSFEYSLTPKGERALQSRRLPAEVRLLLRKTQQLRVLKAQWLRETDLDMIAWLEWEMSRVTGEIRALAAFVRRWLPHLDFRQLMMSPPRTYFGDKARLEETLFRAQYVDSPMSWLPAFGPGPARAGLIQRRDSEGRIARTVDGIPEFDLIIPGFFVGELGLRYFVDPKGNLVTDARGTPVLARILSSPSSPTPATRTLEVGTSAPGATRITGDGSLIRPGSSAGSPAPVRDGKGTSLEEVLGMIRTQRRRDQEALTAEFVRKPVEEQRRIVETWKTKGLVPYRDTESLRLSVLSGALFA